MQIDLVHVLFEYIFKYFVHKFKNLQIFFNGENTDLIFSSWISNLNVKVNFKIS